MNILIIEDSKAEAYILTQTLQRILHGAPVIHHKSTLKEGAAALEANPVDFDLVLLDLKLSDSPEWEDTFKAVAPFAGKVPIIVMSGNEQPEVARHLIKNGAEDYIVKGGKKRHIDMLKETIEFAVCRHEAVKELTHQAEKGAQCVHWMTGGYSVGGE